MGVPAVRRACTPALPAESDLDARSERCQKARSCRRSKGFGSRYSSLGMSVLCLIAALGLPAAHGSTDLGSWNPIFKGVDHVVGTNKPGGGGYVELQVMHAVRVDLTDPDIRLFTTPRLSNYVANVREVGGLTVSNFLTAYHLQVAINANNFHDAGTDDSPSYTAPPMSPMEISGLSISQGEIVSPQESAADAASLLVGTNNEAQVVHTNWPPHSTEGVFTAVSGLYPVLVNGVNISSNYLRIPDQLHNQTQPRTALGLSQDRRYLFLVTIDGRQPGYSQGAWDWQTADWLQRMGAWDGVNMDGGGSTTLVMAGSTGRPVELNHSSAAADPGTRRERTVGSHLGIFAKPLAGFINDVVALPDDTAATVTWTTTEPSTTQVQFGPTANLGAASDLLPPMVTNHAALLTGLQPNTGYFYKIVSQGSSQTYESAPFYFVTANYAVTNDLFDVTNPWKYTAANLDGKNWRAASYDDSAWDGPSPGLLWVDSRGPNADIPFLNTQMTLDPNTSYPFPTYYFRTHFSFTNRLSRVSFVFNTYIDDGAVFYLNGNEICRLRMPEAPTVIENDTLASGYSGSGDATDRVTIGVSGDAMTNLLSGDNVLAVEVHNYNARSPDITFGASLAFTEPYTVSPQLTLEAAQGLITLKWSRGGFALQNADSLIGPWTDVPGPVVSSPYAVPMSGPARFYRLRK